MDKYRYTAAANACGLTVAAYLRRRGRGLLYCWRCKRWRKAAEFGVDRSRQSGRCCVCRECRSSRK